MLTKNKRRKNQWHVKCHQSIYGSTSDIIFQGEIIYKNDYIILTQLEKEINIKSTTYRLVKLTNLIHMFENFGYVLSNKAIIGLDLKFQTQIPFYKLTHLQSLYLTQFSKLPDSIGKIKNLKELRLKHCHISLLPESIGKLTSLESLDISGITGLQSIPEPIGNLKKLKRLFLSPINERMKIQELPTSISQLRELQYFYLSGTNIKKLPDGFENLQNMLELYLLSRSLIEIPPLMNFKNLRIFECQAKVDSIPESFSELDELEEIKLYNNTVREIPNIAKFQKLRRLEIFKTSIDYLPPGITQLHALKTISVPQNPIRSLPEDFSNLSTSLEILDVSKTNLTKLPRKFLFPELKTLNLEETFITALSEDIFLPKLEYLRVSCFMHGIEKFLSIRQLFISNTLPGKELEKFPDEIFQLHNLVSLDIGKGTFTSLPDKFDRIEKLQILYIHKTMVRSIKGIPEYLRAKMSARGIVIYVHPEFNFKGIKDILNLRIKL